MSVNAITLTGGLPSAPPPLKSATSLHSLPSLTSLSLLSLEDKRKMIQTEILSDIVHCARCHRSYDRGSACPKLLKCGHTFCIQCLNQASKDAGIGGQFSCPECHELTREFPDSLPVNSAVLDMLALISRCAVEAVPLPTAPEDTPTSARGSASPSISHGMASRTTSSHITETTFSQSSPMPPSPALTPEAVAAEVIMCPRHAVEELRFQCLTCDVPICRECALTTHDSHQREPLKQGSTGLFAQQKAEALRLLSSARLRYEKVAAAVDRVSIAGKAVEKRRAQLDAEIHAVCHRFKQAIDIREQALIRDLEDICSKKLRALSTQLDLLTDLRNKIAADCDLAEKVLSANPAAALASALPMILTKLRNLEPPAPRESPAPASPDSNEPALPFLPGPAKVQAARQKSLEMLQWENQAGSASGLPNPALDPEAEARDVLLFLDPNRANTVEVEISRLGRVLDSATVAGRCIAQGDGLRNPAAGVRNSFTLYARDAEGNAVRRGGDIFSVDIRGNGESCEVELVDNNDGTHLVTFCPASAGQFTVHVRLRNSPISGSPFSVRVQAPSFQGKSLRSWGVRGKVDGQFDHPDGICVSADGEIFVCDECNHRIQVYRPDGTFLRRFGAPGSDDGELNRPCSIATFYQGDTKEVYVCDNGNSRIQVFSHTGVFLRGFGARGAECGYFNNPWAVAVSQAGHVFVCDWGNRRVQVFRGEDGVFLRAFDYSDENGISFQPTGIAVSPDYQVYVSDSGNQCVHVFLNDGSHARKFGSEGAGDGQFNAPRGLSVAADGAVFVCDGKNHRIQFFRPDGRYIGKVGTYGSGPGQLAGPMDLCCLADGRVLVTEWSMHRVQVFE